PKKSLVIIKSAIKNEGKIKETLELVSFEEPKAIEEVEETTET
ncbi:MAG TPA: 50S ribosomal protein L3, partial [Firmicutes bacterium]|nr:50S ribosomal protein L3 [Bacillota bacterium]